MRVKFLKTLTRCLRALFAVTVLSTCPDLVRATGVVAIQVAQPISSEEGTSVCTVTYIANLGSRIPGYPVTLVAAANSLIWVDHPDTSNHNAAHELGIRTGIDPHHLSTGYLLGDTLRVFIDLTALPDDGKDGEPSDAWSRARVISATIESILLSAWYGRIAPSPAGKGAVEAKFVDLRVLGHSRFASLGKVYKLADVPGRLTVYECN